MRPWDWGLNPARKCSLPDKKPDLGTKGNANLHPGYRVDSPGGRRMFSSPGAESIAKGVIENLLKVFEDKLGPPVAAVNRINLTIEDREFMVLVGPSGCGKLTTLRMIAGIGEITEGSIRIDGALVNDVLPKDRDIAMVFQNYALYPHMSVFENLAFGLKLRHLPKAEIAARVGRPIIFGIRSEDVRDVATSTEADSDRTADLAIEVVEPMGADAFLYLTSGANSVIARVKAGGRFDAGRRLKVVFDAAKAHLFDPATEDVLR